MMVKYSYPIGNYNYVIEYACVLEYLSSQDDHSVDIISWNGVLIKLRNCTNLHNLVPIQDQGMNIKVFRLITIPRDNSH